MASVASAEQLTTANPIGQGRWVIEGFGIRDMNLINISDATLTTYGGYVGYGITDQLDAFLNLGASSSSGITAVDPILGTLDVDVTGSGYGLSVKYAILREGEALPVSVAVAGQYKSASVKTTIKMPAVTGLPDIVSDATGSQIAVGVGCSKIIIPFVPYAGVAYRADSSEGNEVSTQIDLTVGTAIAWSEQGAVLVEYTSQAITDKSGGGNDHTSGQIALAVGYKI